MEDDKIKDMLKGFDPKLSDRDFMLCLQQHLDAVELLKEELHREKMRSRRAVIVALMVGILVGGLTALLVPHVAVIVNSISVALPTEWLLIAAAGIIAALTSYDLINNVEQAFLPATPFAKVVGRNACSTLIGFILWLCGR